MKKMFEAVITKSGKGGIRCIMISNRGSVFTGKAICSDNDDFCMAKGMAIAEKRAKLKQLNRIFNNSIKRLHAARQLLVQCENRTNKISEAIWKLETDLEFLCLDEAD